jgi:hypothetical protein
MADGSEVVAAMDADCDGDVLAAMVKQAVAKTGSSALKFVIDRPSGFKDWNDQLRKRPLMVQRHLAAVPSVA